MNTLPDPRTGVAAYLRRARRGAAAYLQERGEAHTGEADDLGRGVILFCMRRNATHQSEDEDYESID